jgi:hypothetical protein
MEFLEGPRRGRLALRGRPVRINMPSPAAFCRDTSATYRFF